MDLYMRETTLTKTGLQAVKIQQVILSNKKKKVQIKNKEYTFLYMRFNWIRTHEELSGTTYQNFLKILFGLSIVKLKLSLAIAIRILRNFWYHLKFYKHLKLPNA